jgi:RNA polymerase-associated protein
LKPGSPAERAQMRLAVLRIEEELYPLYFNLIKVKKKTEPMKKMRGYLDTLDSYLARQEYFVSEQYTLADITLGPILWRLPANGVDTARWSNLEAYMDRIFDRPAFERSLSEYEQILQDRF